MYNLDNIVRIYYSSVSAQMILDKTLSFDNFPEDEFIKLSRSYLTQYSDTEDRQLYDYVKDSVGEEGHPFAGMENRCGLNVFAALEELSEQLLTMEENEVLCIYGKLLRFREISKYIDEDLLVCAYLAMRYKRYGIRHFDFNWNSAIGHNNVQLRRIMERGIAENHFHLFGSSPSFHLLWIYFMNHVGDGLLARFAKTIESGQRAIREHYSVQYSEDSFAVRILKAALIRIHIVSYLLDEELKDRDQDKDKDNDHEKKRDEEYDINVLLSEKETILEYCCEIQKAIDCIRNYAVMSGMGELTDYALYMVENLSCSEAEQYWPAGERWMIYKMLEKELTGEAEKEAYKEYYQWFYAYLVLKQNLRCEMIQLNDTVGFENFAIYSKRKDIYADLEKMIEAAVYSSLESGNVRALEIRISPSKTAYDNARVLQEIDTVISCHNNSISKSRYYYVFHFSKKKDPSLGDREDFNGRQCRHFIKRQELEQQAYAIYLFRENYREDASRLLGIDACSQEIGCRPEVFAPVFRFLANHVVKTIPGLEQTEVEQLKMTFHVGEDFLDVVDGLRAVDEAIRFLNLQCGDRIGHGTVLGIDVRKWYLFKQNTILLPKQDYLDNVVWLYQKLTEYKIEGTDNLREKLLKDFEQYFAEIYLHLTDGSARENLYCNIYTYYEAWKLRGDEPELYWNGYFDKDRLHDREEMINRKYPEKFANRLRGEIAYLYYLYHYDWDVRKNGEKSVQIYIPPMYVEGVVAVQKAMQREFAALGIGIETNPSSNLAISTFTRYDEHPIVTMYNKDMTWDTERIKECPQINVSINTDDQGIFHTSLENEYALMACAMEKIRDDKGNLMYNRQMIYQWIDNIREMGNIQSFRKHADEKRGNVNG